MSHTVGIGARTRYLVDIAASEARRSEARSQGVHS
jgi:hypothetical protein